MNEMEQFNQRKDSQDQAEERDILKRVGKSVVRTTICVQKQNWSSEIDSMYIEYLPVHRHVAREMKAEMQNPS